MKTIQKITLLVLACTSISTYSSAQLNDEEKEERLRFGVKAGMNYSNVYDTDHEDFRAEGKAGFAGGIFVSIPIGRHFGVQPEVLLSQRGYRATGTVIGLPYEMRRTSTYLDFPLLFAIRPVPSLTIVVGPQFSYLLHQKDDFTNSLVGYQVEEEFRNDNIRKNTLGVVGGVDVNLGHFVIGMRAGWDVLNHQGDGTSNTPRYKNVYVQTTFGYRF